MQNVFCINSTETDGGSNANAASVQGVGGAKICDALGPPKTLLTLNFWCVLGSTWGQLHHTAVTRLVGRERWKFISSLLTETSQSLISHMPPNMIQVIRMAGTQHPVNSSENQTQIQTCKHFYRCLWSPCCHMQAPPLCTTDSLFQACDGSWTPCSQLVSAQVLLANLSVQGGW